MSAALLAGCAGGDKREVAQPSAPAAVSPGSTSASPAAPATAAPASTPAPSGPLSSGASGAVDEQRVGSLSFRVPAGWQGVDMKAPDVEQQLERLQVPPERRQDLLAERSGLGLFDEVRVFLDPQGQQGDLAIVGRLAEPTDPTLAQLEREARADPGFEGGKPSVRRIRVAGRDAVMAAADVPIATSLVVYRQVSVPGTRESYVLTFTSVKDRETKSPHRDYEQVRRSFRYLPGDG